MKKLWLLMFLLLFLGSNIHSVGATWWNSSVTYKQPIQLNQTGSTKLEGFPALVNGTYGIDTASLISAGKLDANGYCLWFVDSTESNELYWHFVNETSTSYGINTQHTLIYVNATIPAANTTIYMYYDSDCGASNHTSYMDEENTYIPNYMAVYNMGEEQGTIIYDSTSNNNDLEGTGARLSGEIGYAYNITDASENATRSDFTSFTGEITIEAWIYRPSETPAYDIIVAKRDSGGTPLDWQLTIIDDTDILHLDYGGSSIVNCESTGTVPVDSQWHHVAVTINDSQDCTFYIDGVLDSSKDGTTSITSNTIPFFLGKDHATSDWSGRLDTIRIMNKAVSSDWVKRSYEVDESYAQIEWEQNNSQADTVNTVELNSPADSSTNTSATIQFAYTPIFYVGSIKNCSLWNDESGWSKKADNATEVTNDTVNYISYTFSSVGTYTWNIECYNETTSVWGTNRTLTIQSTVILNSPSDGSTQTKPVTFTYMPNIGPFTKAELFINGSRYFPSPYNGYTNWNTYKPGPGDTDNRIYQDNDGYNAIQPLIQHFSDGEWRMYYVCLTDKYRICLANGTSYNTLSKYNGSEYENSIFSNSSSGNWDDEYIQFPFIVDNCTGNGQTCMYYNGFDGTNWRIGLALSDDNLTWTRYSGNNCPGTTGDGCIIDIGSGGDRDSAAVRGEVIVKKDNVYEMLYSGWTSTSSNDGWVLMYANSTNGINWTKGGVVIYPNASSPWYSNSIFPGRYLSWNTQENKWDILLFGKYTDSVSRIGYASATTLYDNTTWSIYPEAILTSDRSWENDAGTGGEVENPSGLWFNNTFYVFHDAWPSIPKSIGIVNITVINWTSVAENQTAITPNTQNTITYSFDEFDNNTQVIWNIKVTDAQGNTAFADSNYTLTITNWDTTPPNLEITIEHPQNTTYSTTNLWLNWTNSSSISWAAYSLNGGSNNTDIFIKNSYEKINSYLMGNKVVNGDNFVDKDWNTYAEMSYYTSTVNISYINYTVPSCYLTDPSSLFYDIKHYTQDANAYVKVDCLNTSYEWHEVITTTGGYFNGHKSFNVSANNCLLDDNILQIRIRMWVQYDKYVRIYEGELQHNFCGVQNITFTAISGQNYITIWANSTTGILNSSTQWFYVNAETYDRNINLQCNASTVGYTKCGGYNLQSVITCRQFGKELYQWDYTNMTYCLYGCYNGECQYPSRTCYNRCKLNETICVDPNHYVICETKPNGCTDWSNYRFNCTYGCQDGRCIQGFSICTYGDSICDGDYIVYCDDDNNDGYYEWSEYNRTFCPNSCVEEYNATAGKMQTECAHSPEDWMYGVRNVMTYYGAGVNYIFDTYGLRYWFAILSTLSIMGVMFYLTRNTMLALISGVGALYLMSFVGFITFLFPLLITIIGGVLVVYLKSNNE